MDRTFTTLASSATVLFALAASQAPAQTATLTLMADKDNTIWNQGATCCSAGAGTRLFVGTNGIPVQMRTLVYFDLASALPAGATITAAQLSVTCDRTRSAGNTVDIHKVTSEWGEGTSIPSGGGGGGGSGGFSAGDDANWIARRFAMGLNWTNPGGDYVAGSSSNVTIFGPGPYSFPSTTMTVADAQDWLDNPASNFGWILIGDEPLGNGNGKRLISREAGPSGPRLRVTFTATAAMWGTFGNGCDTLGTPPPSLGLDQTVGPGVPRIGQSMRLQITQGATAMTASALFMAPGAATPPIVLPAPYSCDLNVTPIVWSTPTDASLGWTWALPADYTMAGLELFWQGFGVATPFRLVATNGINTVIGL